MASRRLILACLALSSALALALPAAAQVAVLSDLDVNGPVDGDVFVLAGDLHLGPAARVHGHAIALLGSVERAPEAQVSGRVIAVSSLASLELEPGGDPEMPILGVAVRLLSAGGWLVVTTAIAFLAPARTRRGMVAVAAPRLARVLLLGVMVTLTLFVALVAVLGLGAALGPPLAAAVMVLFFAVKALGLTVVGGALGEPVLRRGFGRNLPISFGVLVGVSALLLLRLLPWLGGTVWTAVSIVAMGAGVLAAALAGGPLRPLVAVEGSPAPRA